MTIFTARPVDEVEEWLLAHKWPDLEVTNQKSPNFKVMLDDRGVQFDPKMLRDIPALTESLSHFRAWWEKAEGPRVPSISKKIDMVEAGRVAWYATLLSYRGRSHARLAPQTYRVASVAPVPITFREEACRENFWGMTPLTPLIPGP